MTFLNLAMLAGIAALSIPVIIHILNRSKFRVIEWGAMHLIQPILRQNRRRITLEQILLLLVRAGIPLLIALAMARPLLTGWKSLAGGSKTSMALVLDNSYSMEGGGATRTNFDEAKETARTLVEGLPEGSELMAFDMGGAVVPFTDSPAYNMSRVIERLTKEEAGYGAADVAGATDAARGIMEGMHFSKRDLVIVSDFQRVSWGGGQEASLRRAFDALAALKIKPALTFYKVGKPVKENVAVDSLTLSRTILGVAQPLAIEANIHNYGEGAYPNIVARFKVDGEVRGEPQTIDLAAGEQRQVHFTATFETSGSHVVEAFIEADPLKADNASMAAIPVWDKLPVLILDGTPNPEPLKSATGFLQIALQPYMAGKVPLADLVEPRVIEPDALSAAALADVRVVILANVAQLSDEQLRALMDYVREGGSIIVGPGDKTNIEWFNTKFAGEGGDGLLPARILSLAGNLDAEAKQVAHITQQNFEHKALTLFNDPRNGNLADADIKVWYKLEDRSGAKEEDKSKQQIVLARLDNGDPFLIEKKFGEGTVLMSAIPLDNSWSNLPVRPFYLPLVQQLVTYGASKVYPPRNVEVGQTLIAFLDPSAAGKTAVLTDPKGKKTELKPVLRGHRAVAEFRETMTPGLYVLEPGGKDIKPIHFVVSTPRTESDLRQLSDSELSTLAESAGAKVVTSYAQFQQLDRERRFGREFWMWCLLGAVALLFCELLLQQYITRTKRASATSAPVIAGTTFTGITAQPDVEK